MGSILKALEQDRRLIIKATDRLIEGTCCVEGDEQICVWDLFGKLHTAFLEHVEFEKVHVLPRLRPDVRAEHDAEHMRLLSLIEKARWEFECAEGDRFKDILIELMNELKNHHEFDSDLYSSADSSKSASRSSICTTLP